MEENPNRIEAVRLLGLSEKLLHSRDVNGARDFAVLSRETDPSLEGADQVLSIIDVLIAANKSINNHPDWYSILQVDRRSDDYDLIKKQYRRLALLLHPDKNKFAFADQAFKLVADAWAVLSNNSKKSHYDRELGFFTRIDLTANQTADQSVRVPVRRAEQQSVRRAEQQTVRRAEQRSVRKAEQRSVRRAEQQPVRRAEQQPVRRTEQPQRNQMTTFWTACPFCYRLFEYPKTYEGCCLRCPVCQRSFDAVRIPSLPPLVPGKEAYYCCWAFFPLGFVPGNPAASGKAAVPSGFPNWMPPMFASARPEVEMNVSAGGTAAAPAAADPAPVTADPAATVTPAPKETKTAETRKSVAAVPSVSGTGSAPRKRGRPRKNPVKI